MTLKDIKPEDIEKVGAILIGLGNLGYQLYNIYNKYKADNPDLTLEQFMAEIVRMQNIPTEWNTVYNEE